MGKIISTKLKILVKWKEKENIRFISSLYASSDYELCMFTGFSILQILLFSYRIRLLSFSVSHGKMSQSLEDVNTKIARFETFLNETLRTDLKRTLELRDKIYEEQAEYLALRNS